MRTSFFSELLDSYVGIRKRTWKPTYVLDEGNEFNRYKKLVSPDGKKLDPGTLRKMLAVAQSKTDTPGVTSMEQARGAKFGAPVMFNGRVFFGGNDGQFGNQFNAPKAQAMIEYWLGQSEGEAHPDTRSGDAPEGEGGPETGFVEPDEEDSGQEARDKKKAEVKDAVQGEDAAFKPHHRRAIEEYWQKEGLTDKQIKKKIAQMERQVNFPFSNTNVFWGLAKCLGKRPDLPAEVKQEVLDAVGDLYEIRSKVTTITVDGKDIDVVHEGDLRDCMDQASRITTVRGAKGDKGVFIGRGSVETDDDCFKTLQEFTSEFDHQEYGSTFGRVMNDMGKALTDVVVIPTGADVPTIEASDIAAWRKGENGGRLLTRRSLSVEKREGSNDMENHYKGLIQEDLVELLGAHIAGDEEGKRRAVESLSKNLKDGAAMASEDLDNLESVLLSDEFLLLQDLQQFDDLGIPPNESLRMILQQTALHAQTALMELGLNSANIKRMERPSKGSKIGEKSDVDVVLEDNAVISPRWADAVYERPVLDENKKPMIDPETGDVVTERVLSISIKFYNNLNSDTVVGTCSLFKGYGLGSSNLDDTPEAQEERIKGRAEADRLHSVCIEDMVSNGVITDDQADSMQDALEHDRAEWKRLQDDLKSFTKVNNATMLSYLDTQIQNPPSDLSEAGRKAYLEELESIKTSLEETSKGKGKRGPDRTAAQQAAQKLWQLGRMQRAAKDPEYAKAMALNDMILSSQTYVPEIQMKGATGVLRMDNNRDNLRAVADSLYNKGGYAKATLTQSTLYGYDKDAGVDVPLFITSVRAKTVGTKGKRRKQIAEGRQTHHGATLTAETRINRVGRRQPIPPSEEEPEESKEDGEIKAESQEPEEELVSNLKPILDHLPPIETGEVQRMGDKLIAILKPFNLKVKCRDEEYEGGYMSKEQAMKAFALVKQLAAQFDEKVDVKVKDLKWNRVFK